MKYIILVLCLFLSIFLESTFFQVPLVFLFSVLLFLKKETVLSAIFILFASIILDVVSVSFIGVSSLFVFVFLAVLLVYQRKFNIKNASFLTLVIGVGMILYQLINGYTLNILLLIASVGIAYCALQLLVLDKKKLYENN